MFYGFNTLIRFELLDFNFMVFNVIEIILYKDHVY